MEKKKRWHFWVILAVVTLTLYNILPTLFFYTKPLKNPISEAKGKQISETIASRVNQIETDSLSWLQSYCKHLNLKTQKISSNPGNSAWINVQFYNSADTEKFRANLPRAGKLIPFTPSQLSLYQLDQNEFDKTVTVQRKIPLHFASNQVDETFKFFPKVTKDGSYSAEYRDFIDDRLVQLAKHLGRQRQDAQHLTALLDHPNEQSYTPFYYELAKNITAYANAFGETSPVSKRYFASFTQSEQGNHLETIQRLTQSFESKRDELKLTIIALQTQKKDVEARNEFFDSAAHEQLNYLISLEKTLSEAEAIVKRNIHQFAAGKAPYTYPELVEKVANNALPSESYELALEGRNPFFKRISVNWAEERIDLELYPDVQQLRDNHNAKQNLIEQLIYDEVATISRNSAEHITPAKENFEIALHALSNTRGFLAFKLDKVAQERLKQVKNFIVENWDPKHPDLQAENFPIYDYDTYTNLPANERGLGLVIYSPVSDEGNTPRGFKMNSLYLIAKGANRILQRANATSDSAISKQFVDDFQELAYLLHAQGFFSYPATPLSFATDFSEDHIFEEENYYQNLLKATRENFTVFGSKSQAILEFSDYEQRILTENKIDSMLHEELLKTRDDFHSAQLGLKGTSPLDVPPPLRSCFWNNIKLNLSKYFRGDDRKIIRWGLDLFGGKTVQLELVDSSGRTVTDDIDLKQGINELYKRVNKLGVSEVSIRQEGNTITLDFPGSQGLSATELVKASSMYFNIVNEKFSPRNSSLGEHVSRFLQDIWNEATVTGKQTEEDINQIAWRYVHGDNLDPEILQPRTESAKILYENGLHLAPPQDARPISSAFDDTYNKIAIQRGDDYSSWDGQTNPLMVVFRNFALEGSDLENIQAGYNPQKGNYLSFGVKSSGTKEHVKCSPRDDIYTWSSNFATEKIQGLKQAQFSNGKGWRMAVILNGNVISSPTLDEPFRDSAMINGSFTQREISQLEADLKAGSLSFTPRILSEKNVSPELGKHERNLGIFATVIALLLVIITMVSYYRFAGVIASIAVLFNLLIMWAALQNIGASISLAALAGIILTVGMAVDANVLVFERIREEFKECKRIGPAIEEGYKKAFTAIFDSNITTIIAAVILLQFDSGPIKGFAVTLIIGIASSMFTALFMTRYFFRKWLERKERKELKMANWINASRFDFLKFSKVAFISSGLVILLGSYCLSLNKDRVLGMDFTGGNAVTIELEPNQDGNYRNVVEKALLAAGLSSYDFQVRELTPNNHIRLFLNKASFDTIMLGQLDSEEGISQYAALANSLEKGGLILAPGSIASMEKNSTEVSGQMSTAMRNSAAIGLSIALLCILVYITICFEFKYAISATLCIVHDVLFALAAIGILYSCGVPVQIDLHTIAALMTIIGYSLNDTIIVFDRIREDVRTMRKTTYREILNQALNTTLSRTVMTSLTTMLVLVPLVVLGGSTIFGFALVMLIGVIFGTLSSLFIAAPLIQYFNQREIAKLEHVES